MNSLFAVLILSHLLALVSTAREMRTCGGTVLAMNRGTGEHVASYPIENMQIPGSTLKLSKDRAIVKVQYGQCRANEGAQRKWAPVEYPDKPKEASVFLKVGDLALAPAGEFVEGRPSLSRLAGSDPDPANEKALEFKDGGLTLEYDWGAKLCAIRQDNKKREWCFTINPFGQFYAGSAMNVSVFKLDDDYLVLTEGNGAFRLDRKTGHAKWHYPISNHDEMPSVVDTGSLLIFSPRQDIN